MLVSGTGRRIFIGPPHRIFDLLDPHLPADGSALDLGCGVGRGTLRVLSRGLNVTATDVSADALEMLRSRLPAGANVDIVCAPFQDLTLSEYDVVVACMSLFFLPPAEFGSFWPRVSAAVRPRRIFPGHFLASRKTTRAARMPPNGRSIGMFFT